MIIYPLLLAYQIEFGKVTGAFQWAGMSSDSEQCLCLFPFPLLPLLYSFDLPKFVACSFYTVVWRYAGVLFTYVSFFSQYPIWKYFPSVRILSFFSKCLLKAKILTFDKVHSTYFSFILCATESFLNARSQRFASRFYFINFIYVSHEWL